jgi:hypothetical protein
MDRGYFQKRYLTFRLIVQQMLEIGGRSSAGENIAMSSSNRAVKALVGSGRIVPE